MHSDQCLCDPPDALASSRPRLARDPTAMAPPGVRRLSSSSLFLGASELQIEHHGALYRLRQTAQGKLILTK